MMDPLASSHTAGSRAGRCPLVVFFALVLFCHSIVAVAAASDSENLQGVHGGAKDSLARFRIRGEHARPNDVQDRIGSEATSQVEVRAPAIGIRRAEGRRSIPADVCPPGMWPTSNGQDHVVPHVVAECSSEQTEHRNQDLRTVSGRIVVDDAERASHDTVESETLPISLQQNVRVQEPRFRSRSLLGDISPPGMWPDSDDDESQLSESVLLRRRRLMNM